MFKKFILNNIGASCDWNEKNKFKRVTQVISRGCNFNSEKNIVQDTEFQELLVLPNASCNTPVVRAFYLLFEQSTTREFFNDRYQRRDQNSTFKRTSCVAVYYSPPCAENPRWNSKNLLAQHPRNTELKHLFSLVRPVVTTAARKPTNIARRAIKEVVYVCASTCSCSPRADAADLWAREHQPTSVSLFKYFARNWNEWLRVGSGLDERWICERTKWFLDLFQKILFIKFGFAPGDRKPNPTHVTTWRRVDNAFVFAVGHRHF